EGVPEAVRGVAEGMDAGGKLAPTSQGPRDQGRPPQLLRRGRGNIPASTGENRMSHDIQPLARVLDAIAFAAHAHRAQRRKDADATPYISQPVALVRILAVEAGIDDPDVLCAAALHDYLEDCCGRDGQPSLEEGRRQLRDWTAQIFIDPHRPLCA